MRTGDDCRLLYSAQGSDAYSAVDALARGDTDAAITILERAIAARPEDAALRNNYGVALMRLGRLDDAKREFERAIQLKRDYPDAFANLGQASLLLHDARAERDAKSARKALTRGKDDYLYVERALLEALRLNPNHLNALLTLALLRRRQKRYTESAKTLERAKALDSDAQKYPMLIAEEYANARNWAQAADALQENADERSHIGESATRKLAEYDALAGRRETAKRLFRAIKRDAYANQRFDSPERWRYLGLCPFYFETSEKIDDYWRSLSAELDEAIAERPKFDWRTLAREGFIPSFQLAHHNRCCREIKEKFAQFYAPSFESEQTPVESRRRSGKFRIGFIASPGAEGGFLRSMSGVISRLDPEKWETVLIYRAASASAFARQDATLRVEIPEDFEQAAETIRELQCDAIYYWKVGGTTWDYFLPMLRLAPIQIASWGVHGTSGVSQIDYFISQKRAEIETAQEHYTEKLVLLNEAPIFQPLAQDVRKRTREELGLPPTGAIYFCPQRPAKYHPEFDRYFKEILDRDPNGSILITLGERDDAKEILESISAKPPVDPAALTDYASTLARVGDTDRAREILARAYAKKPDDYFANAQKPKFWTVGDDLKFLETLAPDQIAPYAYSTFALIMTAREQEATSEQANRLLDKFWTADGAHDDVQAAIRSSASKLLAQAQDPKLAKLVIQWTLDAIRPNEDESEPYPDYPDVHRLIMWNNDMPETLSTEALRPLLPERDAAQIEAILTQIDQTLDAFARQRDPNPARQSAALAFKVMTLAKSGDAARTVDALQNAEKCENFCAKGLKSDPLAVALALDYYLDARNSELKDILRKYYEKAYDANPHPAYEKFFITSIYTLGVASADEEARAKYVVLAGKKLTEVLRLASKAELGSTKRVAGSLETQDSIAKYVTTLAGALKGAGEEGVIRAAVESSGVLARAKTLDATANVAQEWQTFFKDVDELYSQLQQNE